MSEMTATRIGRGATLAVSAAVWCACAWLLARTSVPPLRLADVDVHRYFSPRALGRARSYARGTQLLWLMRVAATLAVLGVLTRVVPPRARSLGRGRATTAAVVATVLLVSAWLAALPFRLAQLWWDDHWHLGSFDVLGRLGALWSELLPLFVAALAATVLLVVLAARFRRWWLIATPLIVVVAACFAFVSGWLDASGTHPLRDARLAADARRLARVERVPGTPIRVQKVSRRTKQPNASTVGLGPSARVILWDTLLDGRFTRGEQDAVIAHELGHVRSRHILKGVGWSALVALPALWLAAVATRRRGGVGDPANLPFVFLLLTVAGLLATPLENVVSRRYEAEADWRSLNATHDPASSQQLFQAFVRTSLDEPTPPLWAYLWLQTHPTVAQRLAMVQAWRARARLS